MIIDGKDFHLDLLLYNRYLKRLVAIDLKLEQFEASFSGQMELYLKWLDRYERQEDENRCCSFCLSIVPSLPSARL